VQDKIRQLLTGIQAGDHRLLARAITIVENELEGYAGLLRALRSSGVPNVVGLTGPPGAGKSTLANALLSYWLRSGKKIAVLAVDPSSPFNYGALLGDRIRMAEFYNHPGAYIRSLASRGALGGLNAKMIEITDLVKQGPFDYVLVETVGVGQSEVEIAGLADCTVVALVPEAGDEVQTLKAGIMEIADIFVVNKADRENAESLYRNLRVLAHEKAEGNDEIPVIKTVATGDIGVEELAKSIAATLEKTKALSEKRVQLLTEKSWQLIQNRRMAGLSRTELRNRLKEQAEQGDFNLYTFVEQYLP